MVLGFISLLISFGQNYIAKICIPHDVAEKMVPCPSTDEAPEHRRLLDSSSASMASAHRMLAAGGGGTTCHEGRVPLISIAAIHQLHIFIFFLAVFHVAYSASTMSLGRAKIRSWKEWEKEALSAGSESSHDGDGSRFRLANEVTFVRENANCWTRTRLLFYLACFFRQWFRSVRKGDYLTMRHGFITVHLSPGARFNFQKYIKRTLEDDFKVVVTISPLLWVSAVIFLLVNVKELYALLWVTLLPLVVLVAVGTKLQAIIARMALEIQDKHAVIQGTPLVQLSNNYFWFGKPELVLSLVHFTMFQSSFQITYFFWIWYEGALNKCYKVLPLIGSVVFAFLLLFLCSYITLPLYALVTQMGSKMKKSVFDEHTSRALKNWQETAKKKREMAAGENSRTSASPFQRGREMTTHSRSLHLGGKGAYRTDAEVSGIEDDASPRPASGPGNHGIWPNEEQRARENP
ncbi:unnamed protein product [Victoria cruziana]